MNKNDESIGQGHRDAYMDHDYDEYAVNSNAIHRGVDRRGGGNGGGRSMNHDMDLYDIFKDFDKDGDGIVDDIDLDDPNWTTNCRRNSVCVDDHDDAFFRAGRYRGLTEEEWSMREQQHQRNLE